jgi:hypothetical protein
MPASGAIARAGCVGQPPPLGIIVLILSLLIAGSASAGQVCRDLPESKLRLYSAHPIKTEEHLATRSEMDRIALEIGVSAAARAAHPLMLIATELGTQVSVLHRTIQALNRGEPAYCDAPKSVEFGLSIVGRKVLLEETAAADPCVRSALLEHEAEHSRALYRAIKVFIRQRREELAARLRELKQTPAPDRASATNALEADLKSFLVTMVQPFKNEMERSRAGVDTPERLEELRNACGGKVRKMEQELTTPHADDRPETIRRMLRSRLKAALSPGTARRG